MFHGYGTFIRADGGKYFGQWVDDKKTGKGTYIFANGNKYVGDFKDSNVHGEGIYSYADGGKYEGKWAWDEIVNGTYTSVKGVKLKDAM